MATNQGGKDQDSKQSTKDSGKQQADTSNRGFASMDPEKQREIASEGGRAAHASGHAHEFTPEEAREAGRMSHGSGNQQSDTQRNTADEKPGNKTDNKSGGGTGSRSK